MVEKNPWWHNVSGPFQVWQGPVGLKEDGGGCTRGHGRVGRMILHRAVCNKDLQGDIRISRPFFAAQNFQATQTLVIFPSRLQFRCKTCVMCATEQQLR